MSVTATNAGMNQTSAIKRRRMMRGHTDGVRGIVHLPEGKHIITSSNDGSLRLWDLESGAQIGDDWRDDVDKPAVDGPSQLQDTKNGVQIGVSRKYRLDKEGMTGIALSPNGKTVTAGSTKGTVRLWDIETKKVTARWTGHTDYVRSLYWSPDSKRVATASYDGTIRVWNVETGETVLGPINTGHQWVYAVAYSPDASKIATGGGNKNGIKIWNATTGKLLSTLKHNSPVVSLAWTLDQKKLISASFDGSVRIFNTATWHQIANLTGQRYITAISLFQNDRLLGSASEDGTVRLWNLNTNLQVGSPLQHEKRVSVPSFSSDGNFLVTACEDGNTYVWDIHTVLKEAGLDDLLSLQTNLEARKPIMDTLQTHVPDEQGTINVPDPHSKILSMNTTVRNACITNDLPNVQESLTLQITDDRTNYIAYAHRSFIYARQSDWENAVHDALMSLSVQSSLTGYISKGIAHCGRMDFKEAMKAFDIAFMIAAEDSISILLLLLIKAIALFNANQHDEAMSRIQELTSVCPNADTLTCHVVEVYLHIQLGMNASNDARHSDAADHFATATNIGVLSHEQLTHPKYEIFVILFGWDLVSSWKTANQRRCYALLCADRLVEAHAAYKYMMDECDEAMKADFLGWSTAFQKECSTRCVKGGDAALAENAYDRAIELYSAAIELDPATDPIFANRCKAKLGKMLWKDAFDDAQKVIELNPSSHVGYELKHAALHGARRYDEAVEAFEFVLLNFDLDNSHDLEMQVFKKECIVLYTASGNAAFDAGVYDNAIQLYSVVIDLDHTADAVFAQRCKAKMGRMLWEGALDDAEKVTELDPSSYAGYHLKHAALLGAQRYDEAIEALQSNLSKLDNARDPEMQAFKREYNALYTASGNAALDVREYDRAIQLYSVAIDLDPETDTTFINRCRARLGKMLWQEALVDAEKITDLNPSSYLGYDLKHATLHGAQRYDEAIEVLQLMLVKLDDAYDPEIQALRRQYISLSEAQAAIRKVIDAQMRITPPRLFDTSDGRLCDHNAQIASLEASMEYKELLSLTMKYASLRSGAIQDAVLAFFQYVMLSHRWEGIEPLLCDVQGKSVFELNQVDGIAKLQSFCKVARGRKFRWAWSDTCCIDKSTIIEIQQSINSMFLWYRHSALTIVYLSDVLPLSKSGALARSAWIGRGWTVQEFLAPNVVLFYQKDWTLYLNDDSPNHKQSDVIMKELAGATGIHAQALVAFRPEMRNAREKLRWSSMRVTKFEEDIAYSLFGIFAVRCLSPVYGENKQNALGRLLQEIIARSGDITCLDWAGKSSEFNSCLPAFITSYSAPPFELPSLSDYEMEVSVTSLRDVGVVPLACQIYATLEHTTAPRFANQRLHLPCIIFTVTQVRLAPTRSQEQDTYFTYAVNANGLHDLVITTEDKLTPFSRRKPIRQKLLLVHPWDRNLLDADNFVQLSNPAYDVQTVTTEASRTIRSSVSTVDPESAKRALRLLVRLGQPFRGFLLEQQWGEEYKRIAADHDIIAQVKAVASLRDMMDIRTLEIL